MTVGLHGMSVAVVVHASYILGRKGLGLEVWFSKHMPHFGQEGLSDDVRIFKNKTLLFILHGNSLPLSNYIIPWWHYIIPWRIFIGFCIGPGLRVSY